ncbi:hypothetical protein C9439_04995 [archaeon SCG-AAA382B04]|nr:hypothetical protein C9439_04995 [archaeon SCG-AAA382B04]
MKRALLLTGKKANEVVSKQKDLLNDFYGDELVFKVKELPVEVAAFITKDMIRNLSLERFDYVIVSGVSPYDFSDLPKTYKGPKNAFDIEKYLKKGIENLSPSKSADELIELEKKTKKSI